MPNLYRSWQTFSFVQHCHHHHHHHQLILSIWRPIVHSCIQQLLCPVVRVQQMSKSPQKAGKESVEVDSRHLQNDDDDDDSS